MKRHLSGKAFPDAALAALMACSLALGQGKPNILFILADDQSYETVHATGNAEIKTPALDKLAASGTVFSHAYNMGTWTAAVCVASRTMFNTGRFLWKADAANLASEKSQGRLWSQRMKQAGYTTYMTGKWHVEPLDPKDLFDVVGTVRGGMAGQTSKGYDRPDDELAGTLYDTPHWSPYDKSLGGQWAGGTHWAEVCANQAIGFLKTASAKPEPFFMYVAFNSAHDPRQSPKEYVDMYPQAGMTVPADFIPMNMSMGDLGKVGMDSGLRDERLAPFPRTPFAVRVQRSEYYAMITHMDAQVARILAALDSSGKKGNTIVIYTADHGLAVGHHGLMGKQNMYDHSVRAPFIIAGAGIPKGTLDARIYVQDAMATALELAGIPDPPQIDFHSLLPLLSGRSKTGYNAVYGNYLGSGVQKMVTQGDYKLIYYPPLNRALLFNMKTDPGELHNLIGEADHAAVIDTLWKSFLALEKSMGKTMDYAYKPPAISGPQVTLGIWGEPVSTRNLPDAVPPPLRNPPSRYEVYDLVGNPIASGRLPQGNAQYVPIWDGRLHSGQVARPGIYFVKCGDQVRKQILGE
jgi:choline-sulfatase